MIINSTLFTEDIELEEACVYCLGSAEDDKSCPHCWGTKIRLTKFGLKILKFIQLRQLGAIILPLNEARELLLLPPIELEGEKR